MCECESDIVADAANVAHVVRDALSFCHQRTQPQCSFWNFYFLCTLKCLTCGPCVCDRAVTTDPSGKACEAIGIATYRQSLYAFVGVAQMLLQIEHRFANGLKAKVSGLYDARVYRTHRNFHHP